MLSSLLFSWSCVTQPLQVDHWQNVQNMCARSRWVAVTAAFQKWEFSCNWPCSSLPSFAWFFLSEPVAFRRVYGLESYSRTSGESNRHRKSVRPQEWCSTNFTTRTTLPSFAWSPIFGSEVKSPSWTNVVVRCSSLVSCSGVTSSSTFIPHSPPSSTISAINPWFRRFWLPVQRGSQTIASLEFHPEQKQKPARLVSLISS